MSISNASGRSRMAGVTLIELVMYIVIVSVGIAGILSVMTYTARHSADPMVRQQALLIAEGYLQEVLIKPFVGATNSICSTPPAARADYAQVCDYHGLNDTGARDQKGNAITGLENFSVSVSVSAGSGISLGHASDPVANTGSIRVLRVDVTVTNPQAPDMNLILTGYRAAFNCSNNGDTACR